MKVKIVCRTVHICQSPVKSHYIRHRTRTCHTSAPASERPRLPGLAGRCTDDDDATEEDEREGPADAARGIAVVEGKGLGPLCTVGRSSGCGRMLTPSSRCCGARVAIWTPSSCVDDGADGCASNNDWGSSCARNCGSDCGRDGPKHCARNLGNGCNNDEVNHWGRDGTSDCATICDRDHSGC